MGPPGPRGRTGLIVGIIAAVVVVLAGAGVGAYLLLRGDDTAKTTTTVFGSSSTTVAKSTTTVAQTTTTSAQTTTTAAGSTTTQTIPNLSTSTSAATTSTTAGQTLEDYLTATDAMVSATSGRRRADPSAGDEDQQHRSQGPAGGPGRAATMMGQLDATYTSLGEVSASAGVPGIERLVTGGGHAMSDAHLRDHPGHRGDVGCKQGECGDGSLR